ncbi:hypothetical protein C8R44DRAFT_846995 [Mycena epipterygia]|nr:hypothetical protein C8R44DRAFT_846995 [Mycena epipterygia]
MAPIPSVEDMRLVYRGSRKLYPAGLIADDIQFDIEHVEPNGGVVFIGFIQLKILKMNKLGQKLIPQSITTRDSTLAKLAVFFNIHGWLSSNSKDECWQGHNFQNKTVLLVEELVVCDRWREMVQPWVLNTMFHLDGAMEVEFMFVCEKQMMVDLLHEMGFRRISNSQLFCLAKDHRHPSHTLSAQQDAPFKTQPIPIPGSACKLLCCQQSDMDKWGSEEEEEEG